LIPCRTLRLWAQKTRRQGNPTMCVPNPLRSLRPERILKFKQDRRARNAVPVRFFEREYPMRG
jgi:hypothetical protein